MFSLPLVVLLCTECHTQIKHFSKAIHLHLQGVANSAGIQNLLEILQFLHGLAVDFQNQVARQQSAVRRSARHNRNHQNSVRRRHKGIGDRIPLLYCRCLDSNGRSHLRNRGDHVCRTSRIQERVDQLHGTIDGDRHADALIVGEFSRHNSDHLTAIVAKRASRISGIDLRVGLHHGQIHNGAAALHSDLAVNRRDDSHRRGPGADVSARISNGDRRVSDLDPIRISDFQRRVAFSIHLQNRKIVRRAVPNNLRLQLLA